MSVSEQTAQAPDPPGTDPESFKATPTRHGYGMGLFGTSHVMRAVLEVARAAARTGAPVLISGEPGTGRETVARSIHDLSGRHEHPFVRIDCTKSNGELEAHFFGTRSIGSRQGPIERLTLERISRSGQLYRARAGTIFFEHLPEMSMRVQTRLGRLLRDGEATLAETGQVVKLDARIVVAAPAAVEDSIRDGTLRGDLVKRLSTIRIELPPLRDRREDISPLARYFVEMICETRGVPRKTLTDAACTVLSALPWPRNAHELANLLERLVLTVDRPTIDLSEVLAYVKFDGHSSLPAAGPLREARDHFEREYISAVLKQCRGRMTDAAKTLGIQRTHLYRKVRQLRLEDSRPPIDAAGAYRQRASLA